MPSRPLVIPLRRGILPCCCALDWSRQSGGATSTSTEWTRALSACCRSGSGSCRDVRDDSERVSLTYPFRAPSQTCMRAAGPIWRLCAGHHLVRRLLTHSFTGSGSSLPAGLSSQALAHAGPAPSRRGAGPRLPFVCNMGGLLCLGLVAYWSWNQSVPLLLTSSTVLLDTTSGSPAGVVRVQGPEGHEFRGGPSVSEVLVLLE
jgi:hypothetical protein